MARGLQHIRAKRLELTVEARPDDGVDDRRADGGDATLAARAVAKGCVEFIGARDAEARRQEAATLDGPRPATLRSIEELTLGVRPLAVTTDWTARREIGRGQQPLRDHHLDRNPGVALALADLVETAFEIRLGDGLRLYGHRAEHGQRERAEEGGDHCEVA